MAMGCHGAFFCRFADLRRALPSRFLRLRQLATFPRPDLSQTVPERLPAFLFFFMIINFFRIEQEGC